MEVFWDTKGLFYHEFVFDWYSSVPSSCQFGTFQATPCDFAYGELLGNLDSFTEGICSESFESDSSTCTLDCRSLLQQIVNDCDTPVDATFSPGEDYKDVGQRFDVIPWIYPDSIEKSGFNPLSSVYQSLTEQIRVTPQRLCQRQRIFLRRWPAPTDLPTIGPTSSPSLSRSTTTTTNPTKAPIITSSPTLAPVEPPLARDNANSEASNAFLHYGSGCLGMAVFILLVHW